MQTPAHEYERKAIDEMSQTTGDYKKVPDLKKAHVYAMLSVASATVELKEAILANA